MKNLFLLVLVPCLMVGASCNEKTPFVPESDLAVIEGYLYAGEIVDDIRVSSALGLGSVDSTAPPINDATVQLVKNGICYQLLPIFWQPGKEGHYRYYGCVTGDCPPGDLTVNTGDVFKLEVVYYGKVATAVTVVPPPPANVHASPDSLNLADVSLPASREIKQGGAFQDDSLIAATLSWQDDGSSMYYVTMENVELSQKPIDQDCPFIRAGKYVSPPFTGDHFPVGWINITHLGKHRLKVYRISQDYADFYLTRNQDTRDLNEPLTNIENGLGIFAAFNSDSAFFKVVAPD